MRSHRSIRSYLDTQLVEGKSIELDPRNRHHLHNVLRLTQDDQVILFNGKDALEAQARITSLNKKEGHLIIEQVIPASTESPLNSCLWQAVSRSDRMDFAIQKSVELGVTQIQPVTTERSPMRLKGAKLEKKMQHWLGVIISACEQSGRTILPELHAPALLPELLERKTENHQGIVLDPTATQGINSFEANDGEVNILIGPEGGLTEQEVALASGNNFTAYTMGPRILRTETAAVAVLSLLQTKFGDNH